MPQYKTKLRNASFSLKERMSLLKLIKPKVSVVDSLWNDISISETKKDCWDMIYTAFIAEYPARERTSTAKELRELWRRMKHRARMEVRGKVQSARVGKIRTVPGEQIAWTSADAACGGHTDTAIHKVIDINDLGLEPDTKFITDFVPLLEEQATVLETRNGVLQDEGWTENKDDTAQTNTASSTSTSTSTWKEQNDANFQIANQTGTNVNGDAIMDVLECTDVTDEGMVAENSDVFEITDVVVSRPTTISVEPTQIPERPVRTNERSRRYVSKRTPRSSRLGSQHPSPQPQDNSLGLQIHSVVSHCPVSSSASPSTAPAVATASTTAAHPTLILTPTLLAPPPPSHQQPTSATIQTLPMPLPALEPITSASVLPVSDTSNSRLQEAELSLQFLREEHKAKMELVKMKKETAKAKAETARAKRAAYDEKRMYYFEKRKQLHEENA